MHIRAMLLGAASLAAMSVAFAPADMGGGGVTVSPFQSYDPSAPNYVTGAAADALTAAGHNVLTEAPAPVVEAPTAQVRVAAVQEAPVMQATQSAAQQGDVLTDADRITALEQRVATLEASHGKVAKASDVLDWAEKVLTKYYSNPNDKPDETHDASEGRLV